MTGLELKGLVTVKDGIAYIDQNPLVQALEQFNGRYVELKFQFPEGVKWQIDEGIKPLVSALQSLDITTLSSCEGHEEPPYVSFIWTEVSGFHTELLRSISEPRGWKFKHYAGKVWRLQANVKKTKDEIVELAKQIRINL